MSNISLPMTLSIAVPAFNEGQGIEAVVQHWYDYLKKEANISAFEIVVCNDGSTDDTRLILDKMAAQYAEIRPLHFGQNKGAAAALSAAIRYTRWEWVLLMDADDQFPIENVSSMIAALCIKPVLAVLGVREKKDNFWARWGSKISAGFCNFSHGSRLQDFNSAFKLVSGPLLRSLILEAKGMNYSTEVTSRLLELQAPMTEIAIEHRARIVGVSHTRLLKDGLHRLLFVSYLSLRQLLLKYEVLRHSHEDENLS